MEEGIASAHQLAQSAGWTEENFDMYKNLVG